MNNEQQEPKSENLPVRVDCFDDNDSSDRLLQGGRLICIDGKWSFARDGSEVPADKRFLVLGTAEGQQHWQDGQLVEERIKKPGVPFANTVQELNAQIPENTWEEGINGPRPPWAHLFAVYLLDLDDGSLYTHLNSTAGAAMATRELKSRVKWKRELSGGRKLLPVVTLGSQIVSQTYKKLGPNFVITDDWRGLGPELPPQSAPLQLAKPDQQKLNDPTEQIGQSADKPSFSEVLNDEIPNWGPPDESVAKLTPEAPASPTREPAAPKPRITKKGVQKIASGRGR